MLSLKEWLNKYGQESCAGCQYINLENAHCSYKKGYCVRYDRYKEDEKSRIPATGDLFDD